MRIAPVLKELSGILTALLFLTTGFLVAYFAQRMNISMGDAALVFLLLTPLIVYMVFTGRLAGLKGPGGLEATFASLAEVPAQNMSYKVDMVLGTVEYIDAAKNPQEKSSAEELKTLHEKLDNLPPIILKLILCGSEYQKENLVKVVENLLYYQTFKHVFFFDRKDRFLGFLPSWAFYRILIGAEGERFLQIINEGDISALWDFPGIQRISVRSGTDIVRALQVMHDHRLESVLVIDSHEHAVGLIERDQLVSKLVMKMMHPRFRREYEDAESTQ